jgi:hypothetical protein
MTPTYVPRKPDEKELHDTLSCTIVALIGMLAGFMVGYLYGHGAGPLHPSAAAPAVHSR